MHLTRDRAAATASLETNLVASHTVLFHLLEFALEFRLPLHFLLRTANVNWFPIHLFPVHLVHSLQQTREISRYRTKW